MPTKGDLLRADLKQMVRFHPRQQLAEKISQYVEKNFHPKEIVEKQNFEAITPERVIYLVCQTFGTSFEELKVRNRKRELVYHRFVTMYLLTTRTGLSLSSIAGLFKMDHTSVIHARYTIANLMASDSRIKDEVSHLNSQL